MTPVQVFFLRLEAPCFVSRTLHENCLKRIQISNGTTRGPDIIHLLKAGNQARGDVALVRELQGSVARHELRLTVYKNAACWKLKKAVSKGYQQVCILAKHPTIWAHQSLSFPAHVSSNPSESDVTHHVL